MFVGVNHAVEDLMYAFTTSEYPEHVGNYVNSILYVVYAVGSLLMASAVIKKLGSKAALMLGLMFYNLNYLVFVVNAYLPKDSWYLRLIAYLGGVSGGIGSALELTAEGVYLYQSVQRVVACNGTTVQSNSAAMASVWGFWSLLIETLVKLLGFGMLQLGLSQGVAFAIVLVLAVGSTIGNGMFTLSLHSSDAEERTSPCKTILATASLWSCARIWLIAPFAVAFSVSGAFLNGVLPKYVTRELGDQWIALFSASVPLVGALIQGPMRWVSQRCGKACVLSMGSLAVLLMSVLAISLDMSNLSWWLLVFYVLQGIVRGMFESAVKAMYADHFPQPQTEAAFANLTLVNALSSGAMFFLLAKLSRLQTSSIQIVIACLVAPGLFVAHLLKSSHEKSKMPEPKS